MSKTISDVQGADNASVNPRANAHHPNSPAQNPSRNQSTKAAPMGHAAGKNPNKVTPIRKNPQGNNPMSHDV